MVDLVIGKSPWTHSLYIIGAAEKPVKIGYAKDVEGRLMALQTGSPAQLYIFETIPRLTHKEAKALERSVHKALAAKRLRGEWYNVDLTTAHETILARVDTRVQSARLLASFNLNGHIEHDNRVRIAHIAEKDMTNGCSI